MKFITSKLMLKKMLKFIVYTHIYIYYFIISKIYRSLNSGYMYIVNFISIMLKFQTSFIERCVPSKYQCFSDILISKRDDFAEVILRANLFGK